MPAELITLIAAIVVAWLVFIWLIKVVKASIKTALIIVIVVLSLQFAFGIHSEEIWQQLKRFPEIILSLFEN
jgi:hypothetical protein